MGYALFVTVSHTIPEIEGWDMCGKTLAHHLETLDNVAKQLKLRPLSDMISFDPEDLEDLVDQDSPDSVETNWFVPSEGLATVHALITFVQTNPDAFDQAPGLLEDLANLQRFLDLAEQHNGCFHLSVDF